MQKLIGKSLGAEIKFKIPNQNEFLNIFTTRPDTIYGATFIAVSINHPIVKSLSKLEIDKIKKDFDEIDDDKEKLGYKIKISCDHPMLDKKIPVYVANFVLDTYGEGAILVVQHTMKEIMNLRKNTLYR